MPAQFQLQVSRQQMGRALRITWFERQGHPCMMSSQLVSVCSRICTIPSMPHAIAHANRPQILKVEGELQPKKVIIAEER